MLGWLPRLADGSAIGTVAFQEAARLDPAGIALEGTPRGDGFSLRGEKILVSDAQSADVFVVAFRNGPEPDAITLALVPRDADGLSVEPHVTMDRTRRLKMLNATTAGMATISPTPVATSASEMSAMTTLKLADSAPAKELKALMIPSTVPSRPMKGALEPTVPR